jgi:hypothetical protein
MNLTTTKLQPPAKLWRWRTKGGESYLLPQEMATTHLFYTLRMIWNHTMPKPAQLPGGRYEFGPHYTDAYMKQAIAQLTPELARRRDLPADLQRQLKHMIDWLATHQIAGMAPLQLGGTS